MGQLRNQQAIAILVKGIGSTVVRDAKIGHTSPGLIRYQMPDLLPNGPAEVSISIPGVPAPTVFVSQVNIKQNYPGIYPPSSAYKPGWVRLSATGLYGAIWCSSPTTVTYQNVSPTTLTSSTPDCQCRPEVIEIRKGPGEWKILQRPRLR